MKASLFQKEKMPTFSNKKPSASLGRKLQIKSTLVCLLSEHEQKEQEPQEHSTSLTNHVISKSNSDENDALMESISTQSPLPYYHVEHKEDAFVMSLQHQNLPKSTLVTMTILI
jgi:hypothetical protein